MPADLSMVQSVQVSIDALVGADVLPFWRAVLGYEYRPDSSDEDLVDPRGRGPSFWSSTRCPATERTALPRGAGTPAARAPPGGGGRSPPGGR